jgi:O-antigen biosynthesis protein
MPFSSRFAAFKRWLWLLNRRRLHRRELARQINYSTWCAKFDSLDDACRAALQQRLANLPETPQVALQIHLAGSTTQALAATLASLQLQMYGHWRLTLIGNANNTDATLSAWANAACAVDARVVYVQEAQALRDPTAEAQTSPNEWLADLSAGDVWRPHALLLLLEGALQRPSAEMVYADHDHGDALNRRDPAFKCDWNAELLWSHHYLGAPVLWRASRIWSSTIANTITTTSVHAQALRRSRGLTAQQVVHVPHVLVHQAPRDQGRERVDCDAQAVQRHLLLLGHPTTTSVQPWGVRVHFAQTQPEPTVSIIIPTRNGLDLLRTCISTLLQKTAYTHFDITVVDNGSDDPACLAYLKALSQQDRVKVLRDDRPFNYAQLNNAAIEQCQGEFVVLLNNDIEVTNGDWLREMLSLAALPGVGAVGARLLYGDRSVQHAGVILGIGGGAGHVHKRLGELDGGYLGRGLQMQSLSAVTAACLVVRRDHYLAVGGLDEASFAVAFNDIDFCLRLRARGLRNLYTPHAVLLHHESVSRGKDNSSAKRPRFEAERERFVQRWGALLHNDPAYNPNLTLGAESFGLADPPRVTLLKPWFDARVPNIDQPAPLAANSPVDQLAR